MWMTVQGARVWRGTGRGWRWSSGNGRGARSQRYIDGRDMWSGSGRGRGVRVRCTTGRRSARRRGRWRGGGRGVPVHCRRETGRVSGLCIGRGSAGGASPAVRQAVSGDHRSSHRLFGRHRSIRRLLHIIDILIMVWTSLPIFIRWLTTHRIRLPTHRRPNPSPTPAHPHTSPPTSARPSRSPRDRDRHPHRTRRRGHRHPPDVSSAPSPH